MKATPVTNMHKPTASENPFHPTWNPLFTIEEKKEDPSRCIAKLRKHTSEVQIYNCPRCIYWHRYPEETDSILHVPQRYIITGLFNEYHQQHI